MNSSEIRDLWNFEHKTSTLVSFPKSPLSDAMLEVTERHIPDKIRLKYQWFSFIHKKILDPVSSKSMWYKDGCQVDAQMNAKIEQSKRHRYINIHLLQRQNNHA
jgi:hypothetical protein